MAKDKGNNQTSAAGDAGKSTNADGPGTAVALPETQKSLSERALTVGNAKFKVARVVNLPLLKQPENSAVYITVRSVMALAKQMPADPKTGKLPDRATEVKVTNLANGVEMQYLVPAVLQSIWNDEYPNGSYVGKSFAVNKLPNDPGKRYKPIEVLEIEPDTSAT